MSLGTLATALLIPPLNLIPAGLAGLAIAPRRPRLGRLVTGLALLGLYALSMPLTGMLLTSALEAGLPRGLDPPVQNPPQAIVVLGGDASFAAVGGVLPGTDIGPLTLERLRGGATMQHRTGLPVLTSGGALEDGATPIAIQMANSLRDEFATPVRWVEPASIDTWENAKFSADLLKHDGITSAYIVTHAWHMRRALMAFRHFGIAATPAPLHFGRPPELEFGSLVPHISSLLTSYYALHEWIGCAYYALRG